MNNKFIVMICVLIVLFSFSATAYTKSYTMVYAQTPKEDFDFTDLNLYQNINSEYANRDFPLPRYIPQYLGQQLYLKGYSTIDKKVIGMYAPRYFDGEKFTNMRIDSYSPSQLDNTEKSYLDEVSFVVAPSKDTSNKCNYVAYWQFTKDFTPEYSTKNQTLYDVYYYYDLGYWYVSEIRKAFEDDCKYIYSDFLLNNGDYTNSLVRNYCNADNPYDTWFDFDYQFLASRYNSSSYEETSFRAFNDTKRLSYNIFTGKCLMNITELYDKNVDCFSQTEYLDIIKRKDDWMRNVINGNYIPKSRQINGQNVETYLTANDNKYKTCKQYSIASKVNPFNDIVNPIAYINRVSNAISTKEDCQKYLQTKRESLLKISTDWTTKGVSSLIWKHYKNDYNIPQGTNLYPLNIKYAGIRCRENETWRTYQVNPISPNAQTPYVECNYSSADPQIIKVGFNFDVKINPAFAMVSGSDSILESYNADYMRTLLQTYSFLSGNNTPTISIKNYTSGATITAYFLVNRSKADGCTFTYMDNVSANKITEKLTDLTQAVQKNAEIIPPEVTRQLEVQVNLLKAEAEKTQFFFYVDIIAKLIFRGFILFFYVVSIIMMIYLVKLTIVIPQHMIVVVYNLGRSKKKRTNSSILNRG